MLHFVLKTDVITFIFKNAYSVQLGKIWNAFRFVSAKRFSGDSGGGKENNLRAHHADILAAKQIHDAHFTNSLKNQKK